VAGRAIIILDIGKTHSKLTLWECSGVLLERRVRSNKPSDGRLDALGIEAWLSETLTDFAKRADVGAIMPVAHGATAALVKDGALVCPVMDYEVDIPNDVRRDYRKLRGAFSETGSPALAAGLNLGAQLFAQKHLLSGSLVLLWPQYWSWLLSGVAASEVTSLGCHTDLWNPNAGRFSTLAARIGATFPPLRRASESLGTITAEWAARTGLPADTQINCGLHDSNAALLAARGFAEIAKGEATALSTGTWFVAMRTPDRALEAPALSEARDCLINVDAFGMAIPSARFMAGREIEMLLEGAASIDDVADQPALLEAAASVVAASVMILPSFVFGCGPFPQRRGGWRLEPDDVTARRAAIALYAAFMADTALDLIGARACILIEGRFANAQVFVRALARLRPDTMIYTASAENDVSFGALRLLVPSLRPTVALKRVAPLDVDLTAYKAKWHELIEGNAA
jgi:sugar (pentulose or hexulose) kinase